MGVDAVYLLDEKKQIRRVIVWGVYELIHDEATYELDAEIASEYDARPGEFLAFFDVDAHLRYFEINTAEKDERRGVTAITATDAAVDELAHLIMPEIRLTGATAAQAGQAALSGSDWKLGSVTDAKKTSDLSAYRDRRWKALRDIAVQYQARVTPYFVIENGEITGKYVDITERSNVFRGRLFEGTSASAQIYVTRSGAPITRMYGVGKATGTEDPPTCVSFADVVWSKAAGDPADKPKGQAYIEDADAIALYGESREDVFTDKYIEDPNELIRATWTELQKRRQPKVSGTATAQDMEHIPGYEHMIVRMYDLVWVRTKHGEDLQAVVINVKRNYLRRGLTKIQIGEEADDSGLIKKIAKLSNQTNANSKSGDAQANRYIETKRLIQLNADTIQMNARLIEANAEQVRLTASNLKEYEKGTDERLTKAELTLNGDGTSANAGLVAMVKANGEEISQAALTLYGDGTSANTGLVAKVGDNAATILLHADELGTLAEIKADKVDLGKYATVSRLEAEIADVKITESSYVTTAGLNTQSLGANYVETNTFSIGGTMLTLKSTEYVKSVGRTKRYALSPSNITIEIWEISSISNGTLYYLGYAG